MEVSNKPFYCTRLLNKTALVTQGECQQKKDAYRQALADHVEAKKNSLDFGPNLPGKASATKFSSAFLPRVI